MKTISLTKSVVTQMARRLAKYVSEGGKLDQHVFALEGVAVTLGYRNRHVMLADVKDEAPGDEAAAQRDVRELYVAEIEHRHGRDLTVHPTLAAAQYAVTKYVEDYWGEVIDWVRNSRSAAARAREYGLDPENMDDTQRFSGLNEKNAVELYFEALEDEEHYSIETVQVDLTPHRPLEPEEPAAPGQQV